MLNAAYDIFSDAAGASAVGRDAAPCIGSLIVGTAVTLYLKTRPVPPAIGPAVVAAVAAPGVVYLANQKEISNYLILQTHIRVYIPASLSRGHQSTTCHLIRRLIALGYAGAFEVVYKEGNSNAKTIQTLLPELNLGVGGAAEETINPGNYQSAALGNCVFTFTPEAAKGPIPPRQFGISGGVDSTNKDPRPICNVSYFLMLQPFQWPAANYLYVNNPDTPAAPNPIDLGNEARLGRLRFLGTTCYWTDTTAYPWATVSTFIPRVAPAAAQAVVTDIQTFCCTAGATKHLLPVYGLARDGGRALLSNWGSVPQMTAVANLVLAVLNGQGSAPLNQGTVILMMGNYVNGWKAELRKRLPANYQARLSLWEEGDPWAPALITGLAANQILIVNLQRMPVPLFNYFYLNSSLPPVFEGKGTMPIMLNSGRPYLQLSKQALGYDAMLAVTAAAPLSQSKVFLYPSLPYTFTLNPAGTIETETRNPETLACLDAQKAVVWNNQADVTINPRNFSTLDHAGFLAVQAYLLTNFYIDGSDNIQNKFKALADAQDFEPLNFPAVITPAALYADLQIACGAGAANVCTLYRNNIATLTDFFRNAIAPASAPTPLQAYFAGLRTHFNDVSNDKLLLGMSFAVAAINANL